jgi:tetratricopeptide (TPR) repeat protein
MPSLSALGEFKSSFNNIANEKDDVEAKNLPFEDFALPDTEAPPFDPSADSASSYGSSDSSSDASDFDFSALLNSLPGDEGPPDIDSILSDSLGSPESGKAPDTGEDAFAVPDELLSGLPGEIESAVPDFDTQDSGMADFLNSIGGEDAQSEDAGIDMGGESPAMPGFDELPDNKAAADSGIDNEPDEGIDMGGEMPHEAVSQDLPPPETKKAVSNADPNSGGIDIGGESLDMGGESLDLGGESLDLGGEAPAGGKEAESDFSLDSLMSEPPSGGDAVSGADFSGFDSAPLDLGSGADLTPAAPLKDETPPAAVEDAGTFNLDDLGADFASESIPLGGDLETHSETDFGSGGYSAGDFGGDEFDLPGIEDIFDKQKSDTIAKPASKKGLFKKKKAKTEELPEAEENIDEISLTQGDVDSLLKTLSFYPLNLRIACEEIIAEQVILPQQLAKLIHLLVNGAPVKEAAAVVEEITGKAVVIPKSFEKMTGAAFEAEQSSFAYIFVHNFLPVLRLFAVIAALAASVVYLGYKFVYIPLRAESLYKRGYERIPAGEYQRANELFHDAFVLHRKKKWFYSYAEAFRDERRYMLAENKYDELLRYYPRDKKGVLDYANLETYYLLNYEKANRLLQRELLDFAPDDFDGLLAAGDNFLAWADSDPSRFYDRYEDARFSYARLLETYGWQVPVVERMMKYFIRTDNLKETLYLRAWFENGRNRRLSAESLSELGGYLLDKQLEKPSGVPNPYVESIESVRSMLLEAVRLEPTLPEPHYHLARYYNNLGNTYEERLTLENAIRAFDLAQTESVRRRRYRVDTHYRYANLLIDRRETFPAEEQLVRGIELYEDFLSRNLFPVSPQLGQLYAAKGDLEYFLKTGNMEAALANYRLAERYEYSPPEIQYRMGSANYQLENWGEALQYLFRASSELPLSRRLLYALGNAAYKRGDYFAAEGYYNRLLSILESQRIRLPVLLPNDSPQFHELAMRLMWARNNAGVVYEALAEQTGNREYRSRAMVLYAESSLAWDPLTRNPETMARMNLTGNFSAPGINLGYLNANNALRPSSNYMPQIFIDIDKDVLEPSRWEELAPAGGLIN